MVTGKVSPGNKCPFLKTSPSRLLIQRILQETSSDWSLNPSELESEHLAEGLMGYWFGRCIHWSPDHVDLGR